MQREGLTVYKSTLLKPNTLLRVLVKAVSNS